MKIECPKLTQWEHGNSQVVESASENWAGQKTGACWFWENLAVSCWVYGRLWPTATKKRLTFRLQQPAFFGWSFSGKNRFFDFAKGKDLEPTLVLKRSSENSRELCFVHGNATDNSYSHGWSVVFLVHLVAKPSIFIFYGFQRRCKSWPSRSLQILENSGVGNRAGWLKHEGAGGTSRLKTPQLWTFCNFGSLMSFI